MTNWFIWSTGALTSRIAHYTSKEYYNREIENGFENVIVNSYLFIVILSGKIIINPVFYIDESIIIFGLANAMYPYWINKAKELQPDSIYTDIITHSESAFLVTLSPIFSNNVNRVAVLLPIFCMMVAHMTMQYYDNPYTRISMSDEDLQEELSQPLITERIMNNVHIGFATLSITCILTKDIALGNIIATNADITDIIFIHQSFALCFSLIYARVKECNIIIKYKEPRGDITKNVIATCLLFNNGFTNFCYISSLYYSFTTAPNIGYSKLFINLYVPILLCIKVNTGERYCHIHYIGSYYCYILSFLGIIYFGR